MPTSGPTRGWYPDPGGSDAVRWWDGAAWGPLAAAVQPVAAAVPAPVVRAVPPTPVVAPALTHIPTHQPSGDPRFGSPQVAMAHAATTTYATNQFGTQIPAAAQPNGAWGQPTAPLGYAPTQQGWDQPTYGQGWEASGPGATPAAGYRAIKIAFLPLVLVVLLPGIAWFAKSMGPSNATTLGILVGFLVLAALTLFFAARDIRLLREEGRHIGHGALVAAFFAPWLYLGTRALRLRRSGVPAIETVAVLVAFLLGAFSFVMGDRLAVAVVGPQLHISRASIAAQLAADLTTAAKTTVQVSCEGSPLIVKAEVFDCTATVAATGRTITILVTMDDHGRWTADRA